MKTMLQHVSSTNIMTRVFQLATTTAQTTIVSMVKPTATTAIACVLHLDFDLNFIMYHYKNKVQLKFMSYGGS